MLKRKIDLYLKEWKSNKDRNPLVVYGARQIGKTTSILEFAKNNYKNYIYINFFDSPEYKDICNDGYSPERIIFRISMHNPEFVFSNKNTLIFFDEAQEFPDILTALKFFKLDSEYDVIVSGSMLGVNYAGVKSIPVGFKTDYHMYSLDFEEFLWAKGYKEEHIEDLYNHMKNAIPFSSEQYAVFSRLFKEYITVGGMPKAVDYYISDKTLERVVLYQKQLYLDYETDIKKYVFGLDAARVVNFYRHITPMLARENHKFQISKIEHGARNRNYLGCEDWLRDAGVITVSYNVNDLTLPLKGNEKETDKRVYYLDNSLLMSSLDSESTEKIRVNEEFEIFNGAVTESIVAEALIKSGYEGLYFYKNEEGTLELDFIVRAKDNIIPLEVKTNRGRSKSLNTILKEERLKFGVKLTAQNIGFANNKYTFPYFLAFLLKRFLSDVTTWD
ncbi:MAG: ATP-binding protein [Clostridia bacterium]|nr:ATP-binding protein [Clostridia bacterium]